ncbi:MAG: class I tRNA ligase family protein, partial [Actinomycetota bacterium]
IAYKWLDEGLQSRGITRDLKWGVPVPKEGFDDKVFYVWFDAPIGYVSATKAWGDETGADWKSWWYDTKDVNYTQFMAKDNVPFHSVMFPATLLGTRDRWKKVDTLKAFNWLNYYGGKFSTSRQQGVFTDAALEILPADYWRYFLITNAPESDDTSFTWDLFASAVNKDLADTLGNFVNRVLSFSAKRLGNAVPEGGQPGPTEQALGAEVAGLLADLEQQLDELQFRKATQSLRAMWSAGNAYLEEKAPWTAIKTDGDDAALTLRTAMNLIYLFGVVSAPLIPDSSQRLRAAFALAGDDRTWVTADEARSLAFLEPGVGFETPPVLFTKIDDDALETYRSRFGGDDQAGPLASD